MQIRFDVVTRQGLPWLLSTALFVALATTSPAAAQMGHVMHGLGPVNLSMGGAATAFPQDALGAMGWNPALITGLHASEASMGLVLINDDAELSSTIGGQTGTTKSEIGTEPMPNIAMVDVGDGRRWAWGLGAFAVSGVAADLQTDGTNPITEPPPTGFGPLGTRYQVLQVAAALAYRVTDNFSVGVAPLLGWAIIGARPFTPGPKDPDTGTYYDGLRGDAQWGVGVHVGAYYHANDLHLGAAYKGKTHFREFVVNSVSQAGDPIDLPIKLDHTAIWTAGVAYTGVERFDFAADVRYVDFGHASIWGDPAVFGANEALTGFGLDGIWYAGIGAQFNASDRVSLRAGYGYAQNPITPDIAFAWGDAPAIIKHMPGVGATLKTKDGWKLSVSGHVGLENTVTGPLKSPAGPVPGASLTLKNRVMTLGLGLARTF